MPPLRLDENCLVLSGEHALHVLSRRGAYDLRGRDIHRLHQRVEPLLGGSYGEADLLAGVPAPHADALRTYLARLREVGALRDVPSPPRRVPGPDAPAGLPQFPHGKERVSLQLGTLRVHVSLNGWDDIATQRHELSVAFVSPEEAGRVLVRAGRREEEGRQVFVVAGPTTGPVPEAETRRRAALAWWLLRNEIDVRGEGSRVRLFRLDGPTGTLERLVDVDGPGAAHACEVPSALRVVRFVETEQLPLVVAEAAHPFFTPRLLGTGPSFGMTRDALLRRFVARLDDEAEDGQPMLVAPSRMALWARAVEREVGGRVAAGRPAWQETDLLREAEAHPQTRYLGRVLAMHTAVLTGRAARTAEGAWTYERGGHRSVSLVRAMALAELLLVEAWKAFHAPRLQGLGVPQVAWEHADFATAATISRRVRAALFVMRAGGEQPRMEVRRVRCWGITAWVGHPQSDTQPGRGR